MTAGKGLTPRSPVEKVPLDQIEFVLKAMQTLNFRALCQEYGVSTKTGYKWKQRLINGGLEGIKEESRRPRSSPNQLSEEEVCEWRLKCRLGRGPRKSGVFRRRRRGKRERFNRVLERAPCRNRGPPPSEAGRLSSGRVGSPQAELEGDFKGWWRAGQRCGL